MYLTAEKKQEIFTRTNCIVHIQNQEFDRAHEDQQERHRNKAFTGCSRR